MTIQTTKNDPDNRGRDRLIASLRTLWLDRRFLVQTFSRFEHINVEEIRKLLDVDVVPNSPNFTPPPENEVM